MNNPLIKTLKAANFVAGKASTEAEIKRHRKLTDWAGRLATPKGDVERKRFRLGKIRCEEFRPYFAHNPEYVPVMFLLSIRYFPFQDSPAAGFPAASPAFPSYDIRIARESSRAKCLLSSVVSDICHIRKMYVRRMVSRRHFTISSIVETVVKAPPFSEMISLIFGNSK